MLYCFKLYKAFFFSLFIPGMTLGVTLVLSACATPAKQTESFLKLPRNIPEMHQIQDVPFIQQTENFCGPASLAMMMNWAGHPVSVSELGSQMYTPGKKGTLQSDILSASRRQGMLAVPVKGISALLNELAAGHPVLVLQNLGFSWFPKWHYAVALGYDLTDPILLLHSGPESSQKMDLRQFEQTWALADYWGVAVLPPKSLSATASDLAHAGAAAALEQIGKASEAEEIYRNILKRWPGSLSALIGLGNTRYAAKDYQASVYFLNEATQKHPLSAVAWHNLAIAQGAAAQLVSSKSSVFKDSASTDSVAKNTHAKDSGARGAKGDSPKGDWAKGDVAKSAIKGPIKSAIKTRSQARKSALHAIGLADPRTADIYRDSLREWLQES